MEDERTVSIQQMREALAREAGANFPFEITTRDGQVMSRYIRGFADHQNNILLISETPHSLAMKILEIKEIQTVAFDTDAGAPRRILHARWLTKKS